MPRKLTKSWIATYLDWIEKSAESPSQYHFWSAATIIGASLKRGCFVDRATWKLMPNMFTILVGKPGIGKGAAVNPAVALLNKAGTANLLSDRLTIEYVLEKLSKGFAAPVHKTGGNVTFGKLDSSSIIIAPELSVFLTASQHTLPILNELWEAKEGLFNYGTRTKGEWPVDSPCQSMLAASASEYLAMSIPRTAVGGGFTRRVNFVYAKDKSKEIPWPVQPNSQSIVTGLIDDLRSISQMRGEFKFTKGRTERLFEKYKASCKAQEFDDEATASYITSKWAHATKLAMVISASRGEDMEITETDLAEAISYIEQCGADLKLVFRGVGLADTTEAMDKILKFLEQKGYATFGDILHALWQHVGSKDILEVMLTTLVNARMVGTKTQGANEIYYVMPTPSKPKVSVP